MRNVLLLALILTVPLSSAAHELVTGKQDVGHRNFVQAKKVLARVYVGQNTTFYCGCRYEGKKVDHASCGYKVRKDANRAGRIEWEHVVTAWAIGHQRQCWQNGGRKNCVKTDAVFRKAEGDLHNLVPAIGEINNDRSNYRFTVWDNNPTTYGQCEMLVDFKGRRAQPPQRARGQIARITFYMAEQYKLRINPQERQLFCAWTKMYPVDAEERIRDQRITAIQGASNRFVSDATAPSTVCPG